MLKAIFKLGIAVFSLSRANILSKYSFPEVEIALSSSNSSETPFAIAFPLFILTGASSKSAASIFKITSAQSKISFPNLFTEVFLLVKASFLMVEIAFKEFLSKTNSLGEIFPVATLETKRSISLI